MILCPSCGYEASEEFDFCPKCATPLVAAAAHPEERKVVTTLFCDLVAFTALCASADPEDIDALLGEYSARARSVIESHGGTVEKFIGDAVVGVFGVPATHEDDPERAVRAGLRLIEALEGLTRPDGSPLQARIGVNTGEALVRLDVDPASGRGFLRGDAVNVAARLQAAAPPNGVAVGVVTHQLTARAIDYEELPPLVAKGKSEPVSAWRAKSSISRTGIDAARSHLTPLVGREGELAYVKAMLDKSISSGTPQAALIVGEPGIGKSRLVLELFDYIDGRPELITWRQGHCPSYGEGVTYWALSEIVKAQAGIFETDGVAAVQEKLDAVLPVGEDRAWFRQRLRALLGLEAPTADREENFTAWLRFLEELAAARPTVLVFEDLHWADEPLLAFLEHLAAHLAAVPLFIVATARPELFEAHPSFAGSVRISRVVLEPLSVAETTSLVASLLDEDAAGLGPTIVERAGGNPFYAEQSVRLLADSGGALVPASVQAVLAARLDGLAAEDKALLGDAAVVGETFWDGALAAMDGGDAAALATRLDSLAARQFVRRAHTSSLEGQREFAFVHALTRDVAYGLLPRSVRARKHAAAAAWLEATASARLDDLADVVAHHSATALELARAAGQHELAEALTEKAVRYLTLAGDRNLRLDVTSAERQYARALDLLPAHHPERPALLAKWGEALYQRGDLRRSADTYTEAEAGSREAGDARAAAVAMLGAVRSLLDLGDPTATTIFSEALGILEAGGPSPELVLGLESLASYHAVTDDSRAALDIAERALAMAVQLGLPEPIRTLHMRGLARCDLGDPGGLQDLQRAHAAAEDRGSASDVARSHFNMGPTLWDVEGAAAAIAIRRKGLDFAERRGLRGYVAVSHTGLAADLFWAGDWDGALEVSLGADGVLEAAGSVQWLVVLRCDRALLLASRGEAEAAQAMAAWVHERSRVSEAPVGLLYAALAQALARDVVGDVVGTRAALTSYERLVGRRVDSDFAMRLPLAVRLAVKAGDLALAERLAAHVRPALPLRRHALASAHASVAEARTEHEAAAAGFTTATAGWHDFGVPYEEAQALLGQARCLVALERAPEAALTLERAREILARLGAKPALAEVEEILQRVAGGYQ
jgi:class 3 adenylate cyclase